MPFEVYKRYANESKNSGIWVSVTNARVLRLSSEARDALGLPEKGGRVELLYDKERSILGVVRSDAGSRNSFAVSMVGAVVCPTFFHWCGIADSLCTRYPASWEGSVLAAPLTAQGTVSAISCPDHLRPNAGA